MPMRVALALSAAFVAGAVVMFFGAAYVVDLTDLQWHRQ